MKSLKNIKKEKFWWFNWLIQACAVLVLLFYITWFSCDIVFISKGLTLTGEWIWEWQITFDKHWYDISLGLNITLLCLTGLLLVCNVIHLIGSIFKIKKDKVQYIYKIVIDLCVIMCSMAFICGEPTYISHNSYVFLNSSYDWQLTHLDIINFSTVAFVGAFFSFMMHLKKNKQFGIQSVESDFKWLIRIAATAALAFVPFFIWKILPVHFFHDDLTQDWSNVIAECLTIPMQLLTVLVFISLFALVVTSAYQHTQLGCNKKLELGLYGTFFAAIIALFIANHSMAFDFSKIVDYDKMKDAWKIIFTMNFIQIMLSVLSVGATFIRHKTNHGNAINEIYQD